MILRRLLALLAICLTAPLAAGFAGEGAALWSEAVPKPPAGARQCFVAPDGKAANPGTREAPWDLASALDGSKKPGPGDVIWLRGGTYRYPDRQNGWYHVKLAGGQGAPVHVRACPGERAAIDGGLYVESPAADLWIWDLEILVSEPNRTTTKAATDTSELGRPWGGLEVRGGRDCKYLNLVIHDCCQGMGFWSADVGGEVHGCLIYANGWQGPDRHHGHCIYTQNREGTKTISGCILAARKARTGGSYTMHAYGSAQAYIDNYVIEDNIAFEEGTFLIGGGRPSHNLKVFRNCLHGMAMRLGYGAENADCEVRDNVIAGGKLQIDKFQKVVNQGNLLQLPAGKAVLIPNKYDPRRANVAVFNGARAAAVPVAVDKFLKPGEKFRLMDPRNFYGEPVLKGVCAGAAVELPVKGEFAAYVLMKE